MDSISNNKKKNRKIETLLPSPQRQANINKGLEQEREEGKQALASFLQQFLKRERLKVTWLAEQTGLHRTNVSRIVHGHILPDPPSCHSIATVLGLKAEEILRLAGHLPSQGKEETSETTHELYDPELAFQLRQIGTLAPQDIEFFKSFLRIEIQKRQLKLAQDQGTTRPYFAQPPRKPKAKTESHLEGQSTIESNKEGQA